MGASRLVCFGKEAHSNNASGAFAVLGVRGDVELPHLWLRTDQTLFVCHAALQLPTQVQDGASFFIVLQCRIMARLAVGMGKREGIGGRGLQTASR